ncbi:hypothetical protein B0H13DRAFT_1884398 [Mycena leptocephala]|nr:hypothetical protein B0H13DRAFT_1884398 [Mycena leptocephala]
MKDVGGDRNGVGLKVRQRNVNREGGRLGAMRQVGNGKARVRGAWVQSLGRTSRVQGFKASEVGETRHNDVLGGGLDGLGFRVGRSCARCRAWCTRIDRRWGNYAFLQAVGVQGESCRRYNGRQPKVKSNIKGEGERERERERDIWEGGRVALRVDEEATTRGGVGKLSSDVLWLGDVGGRGRAGGGRDCGLETWWWRRKSDVARLMAAALTADYAAANKSGAGGAGTGRQRERRQQGVAGTDWAFLVLREWNFVPAGLRDRFGGGWFFGAFCSRMVAGTDLGGSDFFQCKGDFVPAALRERNFFGGEHDFPVMKVELRGEWS